MTSFPTQDVQRLYPQTRIQTSSKPLSWPASQIGIHRQESSLGLKGPDHLAYIVPESGHKRQKVGVRYGDPSNASAQEGASQSYTIDRKATTPRVIRHATSASLAVPKFKNLISPPTFPPRPGRRVRKIEDQFPSHSSRVFKEDGHPLESLKGAPLFRGSGSADYFPWSGDHPEDVLSEHSTRSGYQDKLQILQNDMGSARLSIWSSVKHKSGLPILSSLFVSALERRQDHGTVSLKSTFKPPPRVTLTDTKREAWLKDLADPAIPLRRLSRTIPHGIRGKVLLDHCLAKNIPIWRAVWLAKCVGANEIRAFKRKGASASFVSGGENKWIKEWTSNVEQFLESLVEGCGIPNWRPQITYALQLTLYLYAEHLLDQDRFIDWMITSLSESDIDSLPVWLLITRGYWNDCTVYRRRGQRLALALVEQLSRIRCQRLAEINPSLPEKLSSLISNLILQHPSCFFFPDQWLRYSTLLQTCIGKQSAAHQACFDRVSQRNIYFSTNQGTNSSQAEDTPEQRLISLLDNLPKVFDITTVSESCLNISENREVLVCTIMRWATTRYRTGLSRVYITAHLLRHWSNLDIDIDPTILTFLKNDLPSASFDRSMIYKLISDLIRSRHFSIAKFLQWLIARGLHHKAGSDNYDCNCALDLLKNIPLYDLPEHHLNLRTLILRSPKPSTLKEQESAQAFKAHLLAQTGLGGCSDLPTNKDVIAGTKIQSLQSSTKFEISHWIRQVLMRYVKLGGAEDTGRCNDTLKILHSEAFRPIYTVLNELEDFDVLADVLGVFIEFGDQPLLNLITETINLHFEVLYALGTVDSLFQSLLRRLAEITARSSDEKPFLASLTDLAQQLPRRGRTLSSLRKELALCDPNATLAACSPASESMAEALQSADSSFLEEVELLFTSGVSMDRPLFSRIFLDIVKRVEATWLENDEMTYGLVELLSRLRHFDCEAFDNLISEWLLNVRSLPTRPPLAYVLAPLVCSAVVSLQSILELFLVQKKQLALADVRQLVELLDLFMAQSPYAGTPKIYRFLLSTRSILRQRPDLIFSIISNIVNISTNDRESQTYARDVMSKPAFLTLFQEIVTLPGSIGSSFQATLSQSSYMLIFIEVIDRALCMEYHSDDCLILRDVLRVANEYNLSLCRLRINTLFRSNSPKPLVGTLIHEALSSTHFHPTFWRRLLADLPQQALIQIHDMIVDTIFSGVPDANEGTLMETLPGVNHLLVLLGAVETSGIADEASVFVGSTADKLMQIYNFLQTQNAIALPPPEDVLLYTPLAQQFASNLFNEKLFTDLARAEVLLQLLCIHRNVFQEPQASQTLLSRLLFTLGLVLGSPAVTACTLLSTLILDLLALISDSLSVEARVYCIQLVRDQHHLQDPRLGFLLGFSEYKDKSSLKLVTGELGLRSVTFSLRRFEMVQDATPIMGENDTSLSLSLFEARKAL